MDQHRSYQLWQEEQVKVNALKASHPELLETTGQFSHHDVLQFIGITSIPPNLPDGYIRFRPEDFIVEEIDQAGQPRTISLDNQPPVDHSDHRTLYCDMIKIGIATPAALDRVANAFHLDRRQVGYAGLKDSGAITSQRISLRGVTVEQAQATPIESLVLKNFAYGPGALAPGQLKGNRFTLTIRTATPITQDQLNQHIQHLSKGVMNFYGTQRFGHRFLAHHFGRLILRGEYEVAIHDFLTATNASEKRFRSDIRSQAEAHFGRWDEVEQDFAAYPYTFQNELLAVRYLKAHPTDWIGAMKAIQDQTRMWIYAYTSLLINQLLSHFVLTQQTPPEKIPIPMSPSQADMAPYQSWLESDGIPHNFLQNLRPFPFLRPGTRYIKSVIVPKFHAAVPHDVGVIVAFDLAPGAYATTVLLNLFTLHSGQPAPTWVNDAELDSLQLTGAGSIAELKQRYGQFFVPKTVAEEESAE